MRNLHDKALERSRRVLGLARPARPIDRLRSPDPEPTGLPEGWNEGVRTFYDLLSPPERPVRCIGTACCLARGELTAGGGRADGRQRTAGARSVPAEADTRGADWRCLGRCYESPADASSPARAIPRRAMTPTPVVLRQLLDAAGPAPERVWQDYDLPDGRAVLDAIEDWGLRGRGGAAYPTAAKWKVARDTPASGRIVVANGDEGDPGAYVDRLLLEEAPHSVLAGMLACSRAIGARSGIVYVRAEYPVAAASMRTAIAEANARGVLAGFDVRVLVGAGSYVAGEETALLRSIEGLRAEPSPKPPYPAESGLFGLPTVVQNVETLSVVPHIARSAVRDAFGRARTARGAKRDTKAVCLSGAVARPGIVEVDLGTPLRRVLEQGGGGPAPGRRWKMALVGGPLGRVVAEPDFDVAMSFEALPGMGHAGVVVFDEGVSARALAEHLFEFARGESCGTCTPCRAGTARLAACTTRDALERLLATIGDGSLCGFGQGVPRPIHDLLGAFGDEVLR